MFGWKRKQPSPELRVACELILVSELPPSDETDPAVTPAVAYDVITSAGRDDARLDEVSARGRVGNVRVYCQRYEWYAPGEVQWFNLPSAEGRVHGIVLGRAVPTSVLFEHGLKGSVKESLSGKAFTLDRVVRRSLKLEIHFAPTLLERP